MILAESSTILCTIAEHHDMAAAEPERGLAESDPTLFVLGKRSLMISGQDRSLRVPPKVWEILGLLALHRGEHLARQEIAGTLWPENGEEAGLANLRRHLHLASRALEHFTSDSWFLSDRYSVWWNDTAGHRCDVHEFLDGYANGDFQLAAGAYKGDLLPGIYNEWLDPYRQRLERIALDVLTNVAESDDSAAALNAAERILVLDPYNEKAIRRVLLLLSGRGDRAGALLRYHSFAMTLKIDLGAQPSEETQALHRSIASEASEINRTGDAARRSAIVGRNADISNIATMLESAPSITLIGAGGVGKTSLALEVAFGHPSAFDRDVVFVDLSSLGEQDSVAASVLERLGVTSGAGEEIAAIRGALALRRVLLVLDNCEHVPQQVCGLVIALTDMPLVRVLVTSRRPLRYPNEHCYRVEPLAFAPDSEQDTSVARNPAVGLFLMRASETSPGLVVDADAKRHASNIVRALDGLPLAIEIAASRARSLSLADIDRLLANSSSLSYSKASPFLAARHTSLRTALDWSTSLLDDGGRQLLGRLTVFPHTWDIDAVHAICAPGSRLPDFMDCLEELVDLSFVTCRESGSGAVRYSLPETVRRYVADRFGDGPSKRLARRHAEYYLKWAADLTELRREVGVPVYMQRLRPDSRNVLAALRYFIRRDLPLNASIVAYGLAWYWRRTGFTREGLKMLRAVLDAPSAEDMSLRLMLRAAGKLALNAGEWALSVTYNERAAKALSASDDHVRAIEATLGAQHARAYLGAPTQEIIASFEDAAARLQELGESVIEAEVRATLGQLYHVAGRPDEARAHLLASIGMFRRAGQSEQEATASLQICPVYAELGMLDEALRCAEHALDAFQEIQDSEMTAHSLTRIAEYHIRLGNGERARAPITQALSLLQYGNDPRQIVRTLSVAAELLGDRAHLRDAAHILGFALHVERVTGPSPTPISHTRAALITRLRAEFGGDYDAITELGSMLTLRDAESVLSA